MIKRKDLEGSGGGLLEIIRHFSSGTREKCKKGKPMGLACIPDQN
jgi:hypothetical protein